MSDRRGNPALQALRIAGGAVAMVIALIWATLDLLLFPLFEPLVLVLSRLALFQRLGARVVRMQPGLVLALFAVPFLLIQAPRVIGLYWMATGAVAEGLALLIGAYLLSLFTVDRIYHTGRGQMLKVRWFAPLLRRVEERRERAKGWVRSAPPWRFAARLATAGRAWVRGFIQPAS